MTIFFKLVLGEVCKVSNVSHRQTHRKIAAFRTGLTFKQKGSTQLNLADLHVLNLCGIS